MAPLIYLRSVIRGKYFQNPDQQYAPYIFWYWNGGFKRKRFEYVTREISKKGLNPGFAHCRIWKRIPQEFWMSLGWLDLFEDCLKVCEKNGTHMSYTAGDPCFPDNRILEKYPEMRRQSLRWEKTRYCQLCRIAEIVVHRGSAA